MTIHMIQYMILNIKIYFFSVSRKLIYLKENVFIITTYYYILLQPIVGYNISMQVITIHHGYTA